MDPEHARQLLARERERIGKALASLDRPAPSTAAKEDDPGDEGSETLYQDEFDADRAEEFGRQLAALERAESRLAAGTYGLSVESGDPIPDERLEALPTTELTLAEQELRERS